VFSPPAAAQVGRCDFKVDWRKLYESGKNQDYLDNECHDGESIRIEGTSGLKSARLKCVAQLYASEWGLPKNRYLEVFEERGDRPMLVYSLVGEGGRSEYARGLDRADLEKWVNRQSPHSDPNIRVCPGALVWLELAARPRLPMKAITSEDLRRTDDAGGVLDLEGGQFQGALTKFGVPADVQYPADGAVLEPWQTVVVGAKPPHVVGPSQPPPDTNDDIYPVIGGAGAGAAGVYLLMRGARSASDPAPVPMRGAPQSVAVPDKRRIRIRVKQD